MARNKKSAASRRTPSRNRHRAAPSATSVKRFLRALSAAAITAFSIASCALNPQWRESATLDALLTAPEWLQREPVAAAAHPAGPYTQTAFAECPHFFPQRQAPVVPAGIALRELCFDAFAILHSGQTKTPVFVAQRLNRHMLQQATDVARSDRFYAEARLPAAERATLADYRGSGYSRGHMAPAADMHNERAMAQSFSLANMVPQDQRHNAGAWSRIEQDTRKYVMRAQGDVHVFTGPVYGNAALTIGNGRVVVPSHLYKVVHDASSGRTWVHWQENGPDAHAGPTISYAEFVKRTGLHLLPHDARAAAP